MFIRQKCRMWTIWGSTWLMWSGTEGYRWWHWPETQMIPCIRVTWGHFDYLLRYILVKTLVKIFVSDCRLFPDIYFHNVVLRRVWGVVESLVIISLNIYFWVRSWKKMKIESLGNFTSYRISCFTLSRKAKHFYSALNYTVSKKLHHFISLNNSVNNQPI